MFTPDFIYLNLNKLRILLQFLLCLLSTIHYIWYYFYSIVKFKNKFSLLIINFNFKILVWLTIIHELNHVFYHFIFLYIIVVSKNIHMLNILMSYIRLTGTDVFFVFKMNLRKRTIGLKMVPMPSPKDFVFLFAPVVRNISR